MIFGSLICKWRGHRWERAIKGRYTWPDGVEKMNGNAVFKERTKMCERCELVREVKTRKVKA